MSATQFTNFHTALVEAGMSDSAIAIAEEHANAIFGKAKARSAKETKETKKTEPKAPAPWIIFCEAGRKFYNEGDLGGTTVLKLCSPVWKDISQAEKDDWKEQTKEWLTLSEQDKVTIITSMQSKLLHSGAAVAAETKADPPKEEKPKAAPPKEEKPKAAPPKEEKPKVPESEKKSKKNTK